jgi:hypothetical protein
MTSDTAGDTSRPISELSAQQIFAMIQESAYYKAEKRGFFPGYEERDWIEAEAEIKARLSGRAPGA